jgi:hypothetical protein
MVKDTRASPKPTNKGPQHAKNPDLPRHLPPPSAAYQQVGQQETTRKNQPSSCRRQKGISMKKKTVTKCETCPHRHQARIWCNQQAASTEKSKSAARENGKKGGRPKKECDPNDAPEGYYAIKCESCSHCSFYRDRVGCVSLKQDCVARRREDKCSVVFLKRDEGKTP